MLDQQNFLQAEQLIQEQEVVDVSLDVTSSVANNESIFNNASQRSHRSKSDALSLCLPPGLRPSMASISTRISKQASGQLSALAQRLIIEQTHI
jgi:hypothetical protein